MEYTKSDWVLHYQNGTKTQVHADSLDEIIQMADESTQPVEFFTNLKLDFPSEYDWDDTLKMWQARFF